LSGGEILVQHFAAPVIYFDIEDILPAHPAGSQGEAANAAEKPCVSH
jgi:hypothetical protein